MQRWTPQASLVSEWLISKKKSSFETALPNESKLGREHPWKPSVCTAGIGGNTFWLELLKLGYQELHGVRPGIVKSIVCHDILEYIRQQRPDTKWVVHLLTNVTFYLNKLIQHPIGARVVVSGFFLRKQGLVCLVCGYHGPVWNNCSNTIRSSKHTPWKALEVICLFCRYWW
jgi:hypothetical protein